MGPRMSPGDIGSRRQVGAVNARTEGNQVNEGGELGLRRRRIRAGKVGVVPTNGWRLSPGERLRKTAEAFWILVFGVWGLDLS
jgi:hypothetical protein